MKDFEKHIDRVFQESFTNFEPKAPKAAWRNIEKELSHPSKHKIIPFWVYKYVGVAASALLIFTLGLFYNKLISLDNSKVVANNSPINYTIDFSTNIKTLSPEAFSILYQNLESQWGVFYQTSLSESNGNEEKSHRVKGAKTITKVNTLEKNSILKPSLNASTQARLILFSEFSPSNHEHSLETIKDRWLINTQVAPIFSNSFTNESSLGSTMQAGNTSANLAFGVNLAYQLTKKIKLRTGLNQVNLNYATNSVAMTFSNPAFSDANINFNQTNQYYTVVSSDELNTIAGEGFKPDNNFGNITQQLGFIEIPVEVEYELINRKVDISLIGGASTLFLNNNSIEFNSEESKVQIGEANNINPTSFTTNIGLGLNYGITKKWSFNFEPTFKYQINTFKANTTGARPYYFGIFTGVRFNF